MVHIYNITITIMVHMYINNHNSYGSARLQLRCNRGSLWTILIHFHTFHVKSNNFPVTDIN